MIRRKAKTELDPWIADASDSLFAFANGILKDKAAVSAAITEPWSNGPNMRQTQPSVLIHTC